jgi:chromate transporter
MAAIDLDLSAWQWWDLLWHFMGLSLLAVGGGVSVLPGAHRYLVLQQEWLTQGQFSASVALAQVAPGPNVLFAAVMGWHVGLNNGSFAWALLGGVVGMLGIVLPSAALTLMATRWIRQQAQRKEVRAFKLGMAPVVVGLMLASAALLMVPYQEPEANWRLWLLGAVAVGLLWKTKLHLLWVLVPAGVMGALGWV